MASNEPSTGSGQTGRVERVGSGGTGGVDTFPPRVDALPVVDAAALAVRAGRRRLRLSQRALAERTGLSKGAIGRVEQAVPGQLLETLSCALAGVGLRLSIVTADDRIWDPATEELDVDAEDARDASGRRLPAHLRPVVLRPEPNWRSRRREVRARANGVRSVPLFDHSLTYERPGTTAWRGTATRY